MDSLGSQLPDCIGNDTRPDVGIDVDQLLNDGCPTSSQVRHSHLQARFWCSIVDVVKIYFFPFHITNLARKPV